MLLEVSVNNLGVDESNHYPKFLGFLGSFRRGGTLYPIWTNYLGLVNVLRHTKFSLFQMLTLCGRDSRRIYPILISNRMLVEILECAMNGMPISHIMIVMVIHNPALGEEPEEVVRSIISSTRSKLGRNIEDNTTKLIIIQHVKKL